MRYLSYGLYELVEILLIVVKITNIQLKVYEGGDLKV